MTGKPWISGQLVISQSVLNNAHAHALECYPSECCGLMSGPINHPLLVDAIQREVNEADKYHARDPERFPRTSQMYFKLNELRALKAFEQGEASGQPIKVIYHSHCDAGAYFSKEDAATFASDNQLMWPCAFLVISVQPKNEKIVVADTKLWIHVPATNDFQESMFEVP